MKVKINLDVLRNHLRGYMLILFTFLYLKTKSFLLELEEL